MKIHIPLKSFKHSSGKGKTEVLQFRLEPFTRYAIDIAARYQKRTLSGCFEIAVDSYIQNFSIKLKNNKVLMFNQEGDELKPLLEFAEEVWDENEAQRFINLAQKAPALLLPLEKAIWNLIQSEPLFWCYPKNSEPVINIDFIEYIWPKLKAIDPKQGLKDMDVDDLLAIRPMASESKKIKFRKALEEYFSTDDMELDDSATSTQKT